jgi:mono/diheme cytochrome c family protein
MRIDHLRFGTVIACAGLLGLTTPALSQKAQSQPRHAQSQQAGSKSGGQQMTDDAQAGHALFLKDGCRECHGTVGQGGSAGPRIAPNPLPAAAIEAYIRSPAGRMPPYGKKVLSHGDIVKIHAYLASIKPPPSVADIPALNQD